MKEPEDEMGRLSRALPLWFAETFYFSPLYSSIAALGCLHEPNAVRRPAIFATDWTVANLSKLVARGLARVREAGWEVADA